MDVCGLNTHKGIQKMGTIIQSNPLNLGKNINSLWHLSCDLLTESRPHEGVASWILSLLQFQHGKSGCLCLSFTTSPTSSLLQKLYSRQAQPRCISLTQLSLMWQWLCLRCNRLLTLGLDTFPLPVQLIGQRIGKRRIPGATNLPHQCPLIEQRCLKVDGKAGRNLT